MKVINTQVKSEILENGYNKFRYSFLTVVGVIAFFPVVYFTSKIYQKKFFQFCFTYQKTGTVKITNHEMVDINSFAYHYYDCNLKKLRAYGYPVQWELQNYQEVIVKNKNNENISCLVITQEKPVDKWVIGLHGWTENKYLALRLVTWFYQQGYNILTFDSVAHGKSYGTYSDTGIHCAEDMNDIITWLQNEYTVRTIGLIGNSMGAATINYYLTSCVVAPAIKWAIADCGFSNLLVQFRYVMQYRYKKPWWLLSHNIVQRYEQKTQTNILKYDLVAQLKHGFSTPTLIIHGKKDDFVPFFMANVVHQLQSQFNYKNYDYLFLDDIGHVATLSQAHASYVAKIKSFITKYEQI